MENFIELITNNGYKRMGYGDDALFAVWAFDDNKDTIIIVYIGVYCPPNNMSIVIDKYRSFDSFEEAKEHFIRCYVGDRKVVNNHE